MELAETTAKAAQLAHHIVDGGGLPLTTALSALAKHGGLYAMLNTEMLTARIAPIAAIAVTLAPSDSSTDAY